MAKFADVIGFGTPTETSPGVWQDVITEVKFYGDVLRNTRQLKEGEYLNNDLTVENSISIVSNAYVNNNFHAIRYVKWAGTFWKVTNVTAESPRLILRLGGVYNGPTAPAPVDP